MKSKSSFLCLIFLMVILFIGFVGFSSLAQDYTIGFSSFQMGNDWNIQVWEGAEAKLEKLGWDVIHTNAETDSNQQISHLEGFLSKDVDAVIVGGGMAPALEPTFKELKEAGIPVIGIDFLSEFCYTNIFIDNYRSSVALSWFLINKVNAKEGSKILHLTIPGSGWHTVVIRDKVASMLFDLEGMNIVSKQDSGLAQAVSKSLDATRSTLISHPDLSAVYSSWGMPAVGAAKAIRAKGSDAFIVNTDADRAVLKEMAKDDSPIAASVAQSPRLMGKMAVEYAQQALEGGEVSKINFGPFHVVTKEPEFLPEGIPSWTPKECWQERYPDYELPEDME